MPGSYLNGRLKTLPLCKLFFLLNFVYPSRQKLKFFNFLICLLNVTTPKGRLFGDYWDLRCAWLLLGWATKTLPSLRIFLPLKFSRKFTAEIFFHFFNRKITQIGKFFLPFQLKNRPQFPFLKKLIDHKNNVDNV